MMKSGNRSVCQIVCWGIAVVLGLLAFLLAREPTSFMAALLVGAALAVFVGLVLTRLLCVEYTHTGATLPGAAEATDAARQAVRTAAGKTGEAAKQAKDVATGAVDRGETKADAAKEATKDMAEPIVRQSDASQTPDDDPDAVSGDLREGADHGTRPETLSAPRGGQADDLKQIKGVGPKLEAVCNDMGFYHFDQIAAWTAEEVAWVDANLKGFKGRVSRDDWVGQAGILASGGETEFSKRVDDGDVY